MSEKKGAVRFDNQWGWWHLSLRSPAGGSKVVWASSGCTMSVDGLQLFSRNGGVGSLPLCHPV